jgi:hypothetical protein
MAIGTSAVMHGPIAWHTGQRSCWSHGARSGMLPVPATMRPPDISPTAALLAIGAPSRMASVRIDALGIRAPGIKHGMPLAVSASWSATKAVVSTPTERDTADRRMSRIYTAPP